MCVLGICCALILLITTTNAEKCLGPTVEAESYSTPESVVSTQTILISEFRLKCKSGVKGLNLYAEIAGVTAPVSYSMEGDKYQVSYSGPHNKISSGNHEVRLYDDEGFTALRKAQRTGDDTKGIKPLVMLSINHPGVWKGSYLKSEYIAVLLASLVFYVAYSQKNSLQS